MNCSVIPMKNTRKRDEDAPKKRIDKKRDRNGVKTYERERREKREGWDD